MKSSLGKMLLLATALLSVSFLTGCALTEDHIHVAYTLQPGVSKMDEATNTPVQLTVIDARTTKDKVSCKKNGYGMEMAAIIADEDIASIFGSAIQQELKSRGFPVQNNGVPLNVTLSKFYNDFKIGFFSGTAAAECIMEVQVKDISGHYVFTKLVTSEGIEPNCQLASGKNAKAALEDSLRNAIRTLFEDKTFTDALIKAAKTP